MTLQPRNRRALIILAVALAAILVLRWTVLREGTREPAAAAPRSTEFAAKRLERLRRLAAAADAREAELKRVTSELADREKGIVQAATGPQAQAQLLQVIRRLGRAQSPPIDLRSVELGPIQPYGDAYGQTSVSVSFECRIEQLVQLLADVTAQPELLAPSDLRVTAGEPRQKLIQVRLTVSGVVPRGLVPEKKGAPAF